MTTLRIETPRIFLPMLSPSRYKVLHGFTAGDGLLRCGMTQRPDLSARNTTHGLSQIHVREYRSWKDMRGRCRNPNNTDFPDYGGRGISIAAEWDDFARFYSDMGSRPVAHTLDRIDVNGDYGPDNCRWATLSEQGNNKRNNYRVEHDGRVRTLAEWCREYGLETTKVRYRLKRGWPTEKAFTDKDFRR